MSLDINELFKELALIPDVEAIALGGSRATERFDENSDYDIYVYTVKTIDESVRKNILTKYCQYMEIGNTFWELEDDVTLKNGIDIDIIYRNIDEFEKTISSVVIEHLPHNGYTTCMWHNLLTSKIIFDKQNKLSTLKQKYYIPYPQQLKENIVTNNLKLLSGMLPSFDKQIQKAEIRGDYISINHRVTEFLASYFDIIFAINEMPHPGEKRMQNICLKECSILPNNFNSNLNKLFNQMFKNSISTTINDIVKEIQKIAYKTIKVGN